MTPRTPLDDLDHLAHSPHRSRVLQLFASDDWTRRDLHEETDIPQPTLGRILGSFQDRHWITRDNDTYSLTIQGRLIATEFIDLLETFETAQQLPPDGDFQPFLELGFDPHWFAQVDVTIPADDSDWYRHLRQVREAVALVDRVREIGPGPLPGMAEVIVEQLRTDQLSIESVFPRAAFESFVADPDARSVFADILRTGNARVFLLDESIRYYLGRHGDEAVLDIPSVSGGPIVRLSTDQRAVLDWVDATIDAFRERADLVTLDDLTD